MIAAVEEGWLICTTDARATRANRDNGSELDSHTAYCMPGLPGGIGSTTGSKNGDPAPHTTPERN